MNIPHCIADIDATYLGMNYNKRWYAMKQRNLKINSVVFYFPSC